MSHWFEKCTAQSVYKYSNYYYAQAVSQNLSVNTESVHFYIIPGCWPRRVRLFWEIMRHVLCEMTDGFEKELASTVKVLCVVADDCCVVLQMIDSFEKELASTVKVLCVVADD